MACVKNQPKYTFHDVMETRHVRDYVLFVRFDDETQGEVDLEGILYGEAFEPLKNQEAFRLVHVDEEVGTVVWPNGADVAPEYLYERLKAKAGA